MKQAAESKLLSRKTDTQRAVRREVGASVVVGGSGAF